MHLRDYQIDCVSAIETAYKEGKNSVLIQLPMGCGKTVIFSQLVANLRLPTLIIAHRDELLQQAKDTLLRWHPHIKTSILGQDDEHADVMIASIQLATQPKRIDGLKEKGVQLLVIDEAHHARAASYENLIKELSPKYLLGVTATPSRSDGLGMSKTFPHVVFERNIFDMIELGYLCPMQSLAVKTGISLIGEKKAYRDKTTLAEMYDYGERDEKDLSEKYLASVLDTDKRNELIVESYKQKCLDRNTTIAFCINVSHSIHLAEMFCAHGIMAKASYGSMSEEERMQNLEDLKSGKIKVLTNCNLYTEGFDCPQIDCILMTRPTKSKVLYTQCIGRGLRRHPGKNDCLILDFTEETTEKICTSATMDDRPKKENSYEERQQSEETGQTDQSNEIISDGTLHFETLNLDEKQWYTLPVTQKQINNITKAYPDRTFDFESMTRQQAQELISACPITDKQLKYLLWKKYDKKDNLMLLTKWEAREIIGELIKNEYNRLQA